MKLKSALLPLCLLAALPSLAAARGLDVRDLQKLDRVSSPVLSPDGSRFEDIQLLDTFGFASFEPMDKPLTVKFGQQVVTWGEALFVLGGVNQYSNFDLLGHHHSHHRRFWRYNGKDSFGTIHSVLHDADRLGNLGCTDGYRDSRNGHAPRRYA